MADVTVGPITPSEHDSATDQTRPTDFADLTDQRLADMRAAEAAAKAPKRTPLEKQALTRMAGSAMEGITLGGGDENDAAAAGLAAIQAGVEHLDQVKGRHIETLPGPEAQFNLSRALEDYKFNKELRYDLHQSANFMSQSVAAFQEFTLLPETWRSFTRPEFEPDPTFNYNANRDAYERGWTNEDRQYLRESVSQADLDARLSRLEEKKTNMELIGALGQGRAVAVSLAGGAVDPAGWAVGLGVGKAAQLVGVGARVAYAQGQTGRAVAYAGLEGAAGNLLYTAALDAAGAHTTNADYAYSAAFGAGFGTMGLVGATRAAKGTPEATRQGAQEAVGEATLGVQQAATETNFSLYTRAQERAGADATPHQIQQAADEIMLEEARRAREIANAPVPDGDRLYPRFDQADVDPETGEIRSILEAVEAHTEAPAIQARWGMTPELVPEGGRRNMLTAAAHRVEDWAAANPFDADRLDSVMARVPWLASTGLQLARSKNDALRYVAGTLLESTTGGTGRRRTAALDKSMLERQYQGHLTDYEDAYKAWRSQGDSHPVVAAARDIMGSDQRMRFDRAVDQERRIRAQGVQGSTDNPHVRQAADALDAGYERMRRDQVDIGTIGSARLAAQNGVGYAPRRISTSWVLNASNEQREALSRALAKQLEGQWADFQDGRRFARETAARYLDRAKTSAYGGVGVPANLASPEGAEILRDVLRAMAVPAEDMDRLLGRFSRGGAGHTKGRLDLDLSERVELPDGQSFTIADAFVQDQAALFMQYSRRVSGEVALAKYGVMGEQGLKQLRDLATFGPNGKRATPEELEAFDQVAAEFMGKPLGKPGGNRYLDLLRLLTASSRLGGMAFTQFAESVNALGVLGVRGVLSSTASLPGLVRDVMKGKSSPILESIERVGGPLGQDHKVIFPYQEAGDVRVYGRDSMNALDRIVRAGSNAVPWLSGWHHLHAAQVRGMSEQIVHKMMRFVRDGGEDVALEGMGISKELARDIKRELPKIAKFDKDGTLTSLDITLADNAEAMAAMVQAVHRGGRQIIQGTFIGETGKWAHHDLLRMLTQFRTFSITSMEKQWSRQRADFGTAKAFGILMGSMAFALPIHLARVHLNAAGREDRDEYLETQLSPQMLARATLNYVSLSGLAGDVLDSGAALAGYEMSGVRGGGKSFADNVPGIGYINSTVGAVQDKDPRDMIRALPGGNLPFLMPLFNQAD